jgi:hypothetical protein
MARGEEITHVVRAMTIMTAPRTASLTSIARQGDWRRAGPALGWSPIGIPHIVCFRRRTCKHGRMVVKPLLMLVSFQRFK